MFGNNATNNIFQSTLSSQRVTCQWWEGLCVYPFQSTLSSQRVTLMFLKISHQKKFQSTLSSQRVTSLQQRRMGRTKNFNPHSPRREWHLLLDFVDLINRFQSTLSSQRVTDACVVFCQFFWFQSTLSSQRVTIFPHWLSQLRNYFNPHSPRREWLCTRRRSDKIVSISIHTLLAESDLSGFLPYKHCYHFNPHSPRREWLIRNQPTVQAIHFNPHSPRREWQLAAGEIRSTTKISIHTLLAESDRSNQPAHIHIRISIHTLLAESD